MTQVNKEEQDMQSTMPQIQKERKIREKKKENGGKEEGRKKSTFPFFFSLTFSILVLVARVPELTS